jgi:ABC-type nickel/cobalt efflux system permease component RcnA
VDSVLVTLVTAFTLGFLHALEVDHMIAVSTFVSRRPVLRSAAEFGVRWGVGHSIAVLLLGGVLLLTGVRWPARYDAFGEAAVGLMLMGLGIWAFRAARRLHLHSPEEHGGHLHLHAHGAQPAVHQHAHDPGHSGERAHHHGHGVTLVGLLHGFSGTSAVVALVPVVLIRRIGLGLGYLAAFGVGVTLGMMLYAVIAALAIRYAAERSMQWGRRIGMTVGAAGVLVGVGWVVSAVNGWMR